ncbi:MAG: SRPBCC domain-containing protein [Actinomycetales bacterium]
MLDVVSREEVVTADVAEVWAALTEPDRVAQWFGDRAEVDLRVGGAVAFGWPAGEVSKGVITAVEPMTRYAFSWDVFGSVVDPAVFTQVEFSLRRVEGGVAVRVVESGLELVSRSGVAPNLDDLYEEHVDGWRNEMTDLVGYLTPAGSMHGRDDLTGPASSYQ